LRVDLEGKTAVVTGGGTGIGRAICLALGRCGARVVVNYSRSEQEAAAVADGIRRSGSEALAVRADVTQWEEVQALFAAAVSTFGRPHLLVNNAGGTFGKYPTAELPEEVWDQTLALNTRSVFLCCKAAIPLLPDGAGRIVNITSISARSGAGPGDLAYAAAKAAVDNMTRNLAKELAPRGITVNAVAPGVIDTRLHQNTPPDVYRELIRRIPLGRDGAPDDVAGAVLLLVSPEGGYITGELIAVNGGLLMS
jgi:3-oxoacyl-[acyl-carrier protein] reductase